MTQVRPKLSVILPTHNPKMHTLKIVLDALAAQSLSTQQWELILVDNRSDTPPVDDISQWHFNGRIVLEKELGLTAARIAGIQASSGDLLVFVDDDNELASDYLRLASDLFDANENLGCAGGPITAIYPVNPPEWLSEFENLLAVRDFGTSVKKLRSSDYVDVRTHPGWLPVGAGLVISRPAVQCWLDAIAGRISNPLTDRKGTETTSGGDNDIVFCALSGGYDALYAPGLKLNHHLSVGRLDPEYLAHLNHGIQRSWIKVLDVHEMNPWPPISRWSSRLRQLKAWFTYSGWSKPCGTIRWRGACGHFAGRADLYEAGRR